MEKIKVMVEKFKSFDGEIFDSAVECSVHEIKKRIEKGETIIVNELIDKNIVTEFYCNADSRIDIAHGVHHGAIACGYTRTNLICSRFIQDSSYNNKKIVHIEYTPYNGVTVYVHFDEKDWNAEIQKLRWWKNPKIIELRYYEFDD